MHRYRDKNVERQIDRGKEMVKHRARKIHKQTNRKRDRKTER
jgi:hypothetical protein